ncbi:sugar-binding domain-containing protein [Dyadobacter pollutisoli]|uniref:Beta-galactosidase n=1 Tax=Dyadobacter pollutisoli TaxID=2910158 RepID=A0A9E8SN12_9BACT|nr:sugar-binding domain-containing protein [Dyadobacter pollutisoli]WAC14763.1 hypothetical protein ON006_12530 [Dyadobacter pollutisoli]
MQRLSTLSLLTGLLFLIITGHFSSSAQSTISLQGDWALLLDPTDKGVRSHYWNAAYPDKVKLPGSLTSNGIGDTISVNTPWTGDLIDSTFFRSDKYKTYREGHVKVPFWLNPTRYYVGPAWYKRSIDVPEKWLKQKITLNLERCHWETSVYINGTFCGARNSLVAPHRFDVTPYLKAGRNSIVIRVDNRIKINVGPNSHSVSDHTQTNWNGLIGGMSLQVSDRTYIDDVQIHSDIAAGKVNTIIKVRQDRNRVFEGTLAIKVGENGKIVEFPVRLTNDTTTLFASYKIDNAKLWDEFSPNLYTMSVQLKSKDGQLVSDQQHTFGLRELGKKDTRITVNGRPVFLRGDVDCAAFPLTGFPPTSEQEWETIMKTAKDYGLNHLRFHSWCPPDAAFRVADRLGLYLYVEAPLWANQGSAVGTDGIIDRFIYDESLRIIAEYGNHPSFCFMSYGNEPAGADQEAFLGRYVNFFKQYDSRRLYTSAAGWPSIPENDFDIHSDARIQRWGEELTSIINKGTPNTAYDWREIIKSHHRPYVSHEIGQWCAYPNFDEIAKYTGVTRAGNFEIFKESLQKNGMGNLAKPFLMSSGKLQALCYKADIEAALRTPGFAGFQLLGLHDFPGQGTALVGVLDAFWQSKGYITPEEYRTFCNETVLLAKMNKLLFTSSDTFKADLEIAHFGANQLTNQTLIWSIIDETGKTQKSGEIRKDRVLIDNAQSIGSITFPLANFKRAQRLTLKIQLKGTSIYNSWNVWVYPDKVAENTDKVLVVKSLTREVLDQIKNGATVYFEAFGKVKKEQGGDIKIGFSSIFWNTSWTKGQGPHTLGLLLDPKHPLFGNFPTDFHSDYQWQEIVSHSQAMMLGEFDPNLKPLIQPIDTWFENRKLGLLFEAKMGNGKLLICSADLESDLGERHSARQLRYSLFNYLNSKKFNPSVEISESDIDKVFIK